MSWSSLGRRVLAVLEIALVCVALWIILRHTAVFRVQHVRGAGLTATPMAAITTPHPIQAGVPYIEQDGAVVQVCVSNRSAMTLPPYVQ